MYLTLAIKVKPLKHKVVNYNTKLEDAIESVRKVSEDYVMKKNKHNFDETNQDKSRLQDFEDVNVKSVKYVKKCNDRNDNIIEVYKRVEKYTGYFRTSTETHDELVLYFCYINCANISKKIQPICDCNIGIPRTVAPKKEPSVLLGPPKNPNFIVALKNNQSFQNRKNTIEKNDLTRAEAELEELALKMSSL